MPYADKNKQREYDRERMRRTRAKKKGRETFAEIDGGTFCVEFFEERGDRQLTPEEEKQKEMMRATIKRLVAEIQDMKDRGIIDETEVENLIKIMFSCKDEPKKPHKNVLSFIPDLLFLHTDLKMLKQCGGW